MPRRGGRHYTMVRGSEQAMEAFKMEVARSLGFDIKLQEDFKKLTTEQVGLIGGTMVRMIQAAGEFSIMQRFNAGEKQLMPNLPNPEAIREISNNGNKQNMFNSAATQIH